MMSSEAAAPITEGRNRNGGLFFLDEMDASIPEVLVLLNAAIANGYFEFPNGKITAHEDFRVVAAGNTVGSGAVTIPLMKRTGYKPEFAAAAEASASTGGQIMPPIMGADGVWYSIPIADFVSTALAGVLLALQIRKLRQNPSSEVSI